MKRLKQKDLYRFIPKFLIPHSSFLIARQREKWQFIQQSQPGFSGWLCSLFGRIDESFRV